MKNNMWMSKLMQASLIVMFTLLAGHSQAEEQSTLTNKIESVDIATLPGGRVAIHVKTTQPLANLPAGFTLNSPARIALDFPNVANGLAKTNIPAVYGALKSITLAQAKERTRMVLNLAKSVGYSTTATANEITITLQANEANASQMLETKFAEPVLGQQQFALTNVDFSRGKNGEGRIIVDLSDAAAGINIKQKGKTIIVDFINTDVPANLQRRLNVINFNTPVVYVDTMKQGRNGRMVIEPKGNWEQSAYQADKKFIIDVRQIVDDPDKLVRGSKPGYAGEKLSLNFQNIEVRSVLQVIADFTGLNIITSDTVGGNLTLRLKDVPWDQALDIIMQSKGLAQRKNGNVILVKPSEEWAAKDKQENEAALQKDDLEPLLTEVFTLNYMKAADLLKVINDPKQKILSKRGTATQDIRTNNVFVQDIPKRLEQVQAIVKKADVAVKQVMIESRLVLATEKFSKDLGARFGVQHQATSGKNSLAIGGSLDTTSAAAGGFGGSLSTGGLNSNLPVSGAFGTVAFSLFRLPAGLLLNLELSALESDQRGKIISSPRVTTANQQKAVISQGQKVGYLQASSSGAANVAFIDAVLSLDVTPQITPDNKIIMDLEVRKDSVAGTLANVPLIDTQSVKTQVLVSNGETAVLGGIYEQEQHNDVDKVPFFGSLPVVGNLFRRTMKQDDKRELLIFITPKIMDDSLGLR